MFDEKKVDPLRFALLLAHIAALKTTGADIALYQAEDLYCMVKACYVEPEVPVMAPSVVDIGELNNLLRHMQAFRTNTFGGNGVSKIEAIKAYRNVVGRDQYGNCHIGLKEAKDAVERYC